MKCMKLPSYPMIGFLSMQVPLVTNESLDLQPYKYCSFSLSHTVKIPKILIIWTYLNYMKISIFLIINFSFECHAAQSNQQQAVYNEIRHWAMPNFQMVAKDDRIEIRKPTYNRSLIERNRKILKIMKSMENHGRSNSKMGSIWHSYTKHLF